MREVPTSSSRTPERILTWYIPALPTPVPLIFHSLSSSRLASRICKEPHLYTLQVGKVLRVKKGVSQQASGPLASLEERLWSVYPKLSSAGMIQRKGRISLLQQLYLGVYLSSHLPTHSKRTCRPCSRILCKVRNTAQWNMIPIHRGRGGPDKLMS